MIDVIRKYLMKCPHLDELSKLDVDFLDKEAENYSIEVYPGEPILKKYVDGGAMKQVHFAICSRSFYGEDVSVNVENLGLFDKIAEWMKDNNTEKKLPKLKSGKMAIEFQTVSSGYLFDSTEDTAKYQIQCKFIYFDERG